MQRASRRPSMWQAPHPLAVSHLPRGDLPARDRSIVLQRGRLCVGPPIARRFATGDWLPTSASRPSTCDGMRSTQHDRHSPDRSSEARLEQPSLALAAIARCTNNGGEAPSSRVALGSTIKRPSWPSDVLVQRPSCVPTEEGLDDAFGLRAPYSLVETSARGPLRAAAAGPSAILLPTLAGSRTIARCSCRGRSQNPMALGEKYDCKRPSRCERAHLSCLLLRCPRLLTRPTIR